MTYYQAIKLKIVKKVRADQAVELSSKLDNVRQMYKITNVFDSAWYGYGIKIQLY